MRTTDDQETAQIAAITGLDAWSQDNQYIGTVGGPVPAAPEDEIGAERGVYDPTDADGHVLGARRVVIEGAGTAIQARIIVPLSTLAVDLRGRRVVVPLTVAEIEAMPNRDPNLSPNASCR